MRKNCLFKFDDCKFSTSVLELCKLNEKTFKRLSKFDNIEIDNELIKDPKNIKNSFNNKFTSIGCSSSDSIP